MKILDAALFSPEILSLRTAIDERLDLYSSFGRNLQDSLDDDPPTWQMADDTPDRLCEAIRYMLLAPAKRIRPLLVLTAAKVCDGNSADNNPIADTELIQRALPVACAVEMIHAYSLIHDDLPAMDDDDMRRGRPSCHVQFDEATAILAGDALIPLAFEVISQEMQPVSTAARCVRVLAKAAGAARLVGGQADDLAGEFSNGTLEDLEKIHRRKTGALLTASLELGGIAADASDTELQSLTYFGKHLGLAFQIVDDLLDLRGEQAKMGKRTNKDASLGKMTYPALLGETQSEQRTRELVDAAIDAIEPFGESGRPLEQIARVVIDRTR